MRFVCDDCKKQHHKKCRSGNWCDCLHRAVDVDDFIQAIERMEKEVQANGL